MPKTLITICARSGSKGVPGKNLRKMHGKPLIMWTIEQAKKYADADICVSSDSDEILEIASSVNTIKRPDELAQDDTPKLDVIRHAVDIMSRRLQSDYDVVVDLDATNPIRKPEDIGNSIEKMRETDASVVVSAVKARKNPYFNMLEDFYDYQRIVKGGHEVNIANRQEAPQCWDMNASITVFDRQFLDDNDFANTPTATPRLAVYEMSEESSFDIDTPFDWEVVEWLMGKDLKPGKSQKSKKAKTHRGVGGSGKSITSTSAKGSTSDTVATSKRG